MENTNSVCFINKISSIEDIAGADKIELATVEGWTSIVQKNIHKSGDLVLCITTDAVIPEELSVKWGVKDYLRKGSRVRTVKLRGTYSECILIPLFDIPKVDIFEGMDMMETLGIFKYEPPIKQINLGNGKKVRYQDNPNFHIYHKFPNGKNVPSMFDTNDEVIITRKIHGTNARYGVVKKSKLSLVDRIKKFFGNKWAEYTYVYGSHHVEKGSESQGFYSTDVWRTVAEKNGLQEKIWKYVKSNYDPEQLGSGIILYGEIYGPGIQKNFDYNLDELKISFFDVELDKKYLEETLWRGLLKNMGLYDKVDILYSGKWNPDIENSLIVNQWIDPIKKIPHEGIVVKAASGSREKIYKRINPDYLIYGEKHDVGEDH